MFPYFLTLKEQKKLELFQFFLFTKERQTNQDIIKKFHFKNTTYQRYIEELSVNLYHVFGKSIIVSNDLRRGIKIKLSPDITMDYAFSKLRFYYMKSNPMFILIKKLITKNYHSVNEISLDTNYSVAVVYRLLKQLKEILSPFNVTLTLKNSYNFDGDEMGVRYFLYIIYWNIFQGSFDYPLSDSFTNLDILKKRLHIKKELSPTQETRLKIIANIVSYRIVFHQKTVDVSDDLLEDIKYFEYDKPTLNIEHNITSKELLRNESLLFNFLVRGSIFNITTFKEKEDFVHKYENSTLKIGKQVTSFLDSFKKELNITYTSVNYIESYYMMLMSFIYVKHFHFKADDYIANPISDNIVFYQDHKNYMKILPHINPLIKKLPFQDKIRNSDVHTFSLLLYILYEMNSKPKAISIYVTHNTNMAEVNFIKSGIRKVFNLDLISFSETPYDANLIITDTSEGSFNSKNVFCFRKTSDKETWAKLYEFILQYMLKDIFK